jgi:hypothetical protein
MAQLYKKTGSCSRPSGPQTDYPMYLVVGEGASVYGAPVSGRYIKFTIATNWGDSLCAMTSLWACGKDGNKLNNEGMTHTKSTILNGSAEACSNTNTSDYWQWYISNAPATWTVDLGSSQHIYYIKTQGYNQVRNMKDFTVHVSDNGSDWTEILDTQTADSASAQTFQVADLFDVCCDAHCKTDFGDIRFHDATDAELKYWIDRGTLTGTTPNQSVVMYVSASPGTTATDVVLKYGDSALTDASDGTAVFIKYKPFESGSDGDSIADADEDWTVSQGTIEIDTAQKYAGTRSAKLVGSASEQRAILSLTAQSNVYEISMWCYKESACTNFSPITHGNGTYAICLYMDVSENIKYYRGGWQSVDTGYDCVADAWFSISVRNIDFTAATFDIYYNGVCIVEDAEMVSSDILVNELQIYNGSGAGNDAWIDDLIVRKYASPEPVWGTWGAETAIDLGFSVASETAVLGPSATGQPGISAASVTGALSPSASAAPAAVSIAPIAAVLGPSASAGIGLSIASVIAALGPSASADFSINSDSGVIVISGSAVLGPSASAGVQIAVSSQTATLGPSASISGLSLSLAAGSAVLSPSATAAPAVGVTATPAILGPAVTIGALNLSVPAGTATLNPSATAGAMDVFKYENPVILYYFTLTGTADGLSDVVIPISSFQARYRNGESTYLSVVIPDYATYESIVDARLNGDMVLTMAYSHAGAIYHQEEIMRVDLDTNGIRKDQGGKSQSITLVGHRTTSFTAKTITLRDVTYRRTGNAGEISYRCANPDIFLRPGDTAVYGTDSFTVGSIAYAVSAGYISMDVTEALS